MAELFTEPVLEKDQKQKPGGKVKALQKGPPGSNKQMKKTVGSQVRDYLSPDARKWSSGFLSRLETNWPMQL